MAEEISPGEVRPLRDFFHPQSTSPSILSSPLPDQSPDLSNVISSERQSSNIDLTRSISCSNTAISSSGSGLAASLADGGTCSSCAPSEATATLTFQDLKVLVELGGLAKTILEGASGYAEPGKLLGIMGPPHSGTTTLLETLAGKLTRNAVYSGEILLNGRRQQLTYGTSAHVILKDIYPVGTLTVQETVYFSTRLRLPDSISYKDKIGVADRMIEDMGLWDCANLRVGNSFCKSDLTNEEKMRLSLALELLTDPHLLYLDEPVSGLDGAGALRFLARLKCLAMDRSQTVILTFHHLSADCFELIDDLCLLVRGRMVYFGDASAASEHFARSGYACLAGHNAPEHLIRTLDPTYDQIAGAISSSVSGFLLDDPGRIEVQQLLKDRSVQVLRVLSSRYAQSSVAATAVARRKELAKKKGAVLVMSGHHASFKRQILVLLHRSMLNCTRDLSFFCSRLVISVLLALVVGTIFSNLERVVDSHSMNAIQYRFSCLFVLLESLMLVAVVGGTPFHSRELSVYMSERQNPHYSLEAFLVGRTAASLPFAWITSGVASSVVYFMVGLRAGVEQFAYFAGALIPAALLATEGLAELVHVSLLLLPPPMPSPTPYMALVASLSVQVLCMLVAGYFMHLEDLPKPVWRYPLSYMSFHTYALRGLFKNELHDNYFSSVGQTRETVLSPYGTDPPSKWKDLLIVTCIAVLCRIALYSCILAHKQLQPYFRLLQIQRENNEAAKRILKMQQMKKAGKPDRFQPAGSEVSS